MGVELAAVENDPDDHGEGRFKTPSNTTVKVMNKPIIVKGDDANGDNQGHTNPEAEGTSATVFAYNVKVHRVNDTRNCGAKTVKDGNTTVYVG